MLTFLLSRKPVVVGVAVLATLLTVRAQSETIRQVQEKLAEGESMEGEGSFKEDLKEIGIGAAAGGVLGGILGGKKGALAGVLIGGGGVFLATKGEQVELPAETRLIVELTEGVTLRVAKRGGAF